MSSAVAAGVAVGLRRPGPPAWRPRRVVALVPGLVVASVGTTAGWAAHHLAPPVSGHVVAVMVGAALANLGWADGRLRPGLACAGRTVLRAGVVLLGLRLSLGDVTALGPRALVAVVLVVVGTFVGVQWLGRRLGVSPALALLVATGSAVCGASAVAAVHPLSSADDDDVAYAIAAVTLCGTLAIAVLPVVGHLLGLDDATFGAWVGAGVHDVGQVVATASVRGDTSLAQAVVVKLTRVAMLAPLVAVVAIAARTRRTGGPGAEVRRVLPWFVALFLVAVVVRSTGLLPDPLLDRARSAEGLLLGAGLVGLGANVRVARLRALGGRPLLLALGSWAAVAVLSLVAVLGAGL